jgi:protein gp37
MASFTPIEWTDATWNPVVGCSVVSSGCTNCYAMKQANRLLDGNPKSPHYAGTTRKVNGNSVWTGKVALAPEHILIQPLRWKRPRRIFVNSMGDLFHKNVPDEWIDQIFSIMGHCTQHTFQLLTKRPERMRDYIQRWQPAKSGNPRDPKDCYPFITRDGVDANKRLKREPLYTIWPLPNVWLGVSAENQPTADERIPILLNTPAAKRFVSCEPLLGPVDLEILEYDKSLFNSLEGVGLEMNGGQPYQLSGNQLDWVIVGGESGPNARPVHPEWVRSLRDQCLGAKVPFFFKQWGEFATIYDRDVDDPDWHYCQDYENASPKGRWLNLAGGHGFHGDRIVRVDRVGKARAGRTLDGCIWDEMPGDIMP